MNRIRLFYTGTKRWTKVLRFCFHLYVFEYQNSVIYTTFLYRHEAPEKTFTFLLFIYTRLNSTISVIYNYTYWKVGMPQFVRILNFKNASIYTSKTLIFDEILNKKNNIYIQSNFWTQHDK